ncbi:MAG: thioredoxin domain-containing protein [Terriglobia bacterium]|nr:thioredoxin domain-containing protein [Terriglobia bacterium]
MYRKIALIMASAAFMTGFAFAQQSPKTPIKTAKPAKASTSNSAKTAAPAEKKTEEVPATDAKLPDQATVLAFYNRMFGFQPNLNFKVADIRWSQVPGVAEVTALASTPEGQQVAKLYVMPDGKHAINGEMIPFGADPYSDNRQLLQKAFGPTRGSATPSVTIVEFGDLECPACKAAQPIVDRLLSNEPNARLIFQSFPLAELHPWAMEAASYLDCIYRTSNQDANTFIEAIYTNQGEITKENAIDKLKQYAQQAGADPAKIATCAASLDTRERIEKSIDLGRKVKVTGTPTLFVNGRPISNVGGVPYDTLKALVDFEATQKQ